ncbi:LCP family protein [Actinospongicola halichondriae]|uniref:LCP family protein n=1 Tax=Actinospongicola halichondriae TaxID=3236844 RepID=UPI003D4977DB
MARPRPEPAPPRAPAATPQRVVVPAPQATSTPPRPAASAPPGRRPPPSAPQAEADPAGWRRFVPSRRVVVGTLVVLALLVVGTGLWGYSKFKSIETVDLSAVLASDNGTNYLIVGSDTREGIDPDDPNAGAIIGDDTIGGPERSDTVLILRIDGEGARMLSVPRDLYLTISETGERSRINSAFNGGPSRLIATLRDQLDLPIHHYLEVDFVSFSGMVDALGGITIDFPNPAFDTHSGLNVPDAGPQTLDGSQALAYVRSRFYTEVVDGRNVPEGTGDIGRVVRQQQFLSAVMAAIGEERNPIALARIADELAAGMRIDSDLGFLEAVNLLRRMRGLDPAPNSMPTSNFTTSAGAAVLRLVQPGADEILAQFGSSGSRIE